MHCTARDTLHDRCARRPAERAQARARNDELKADLELKELNPSGVLFKPRRNGQIENAWRSADALVEANDHLQLISHSCSTPDLEEALHLLPQKCPKGRARLLDRDGASPSGSDTN
eukprot:1533854-Prymnesium_polylepis.3